MNGKTRLRQVMKRLRADMPLTELEWRSHAITARLIDLLDWSTKARIHVYSSNRTSHEVDTTEFINYVQQTHDTVHLTKGVPSAVAKQPSDKFDVIIVPLLAFDPQGNRLGYGGGWYDKFLASQPNALIIGLAYDLQRVDYIPVEPHDIRIGTIITETTTYLN